MKSNVTKMQIPKDWREVKLGDIGVFSKGAGIGKDEVTETGHNAVRYGELYTKHHFHIRRMYSHIPDEVVPSTKQIKYGDILFAGSGETIDEIGKSAAYLLKEPCYAGGDIIVFTPKDADSLFLSYFLNVGEARKKLRVLGQGQSVVHVYKSDIEKLSVHIPPFPEQKRIVKVLETWDRAIELVERKIALKREVKKGLMQRLLTGKVRLPGFSGEWGPIKLGDIYSERKKKFKETEELKLYSLTIENGVCPKTERYDRSFLVKGDKEYKATQKDDLVYNPANLRFGAIARNKNEKEVLLSPIYQVLYVTDEMKHNADFLGHLLTWERQIRKMSTYAEGTLVERMEVKIDSFKQIIIDIPEKDEQDAIAEVFNGADKEIELLQQKLTLLEDQNKYLLNNLVTGAIRTPKQL